MENILINCFHFYPTITPRAFRSIELVKELKKRNYNVILSIPLGYKEYENDILNLYKVDKIIFYGKECLNKQENKKLEGDNSIKLISSKNRIKNIIKYFILDRAFWLGIDNYKALKESKIKYKAIISVGLPIGVHFGTALYKKALNYELISIADYGDPYYYNPLTKVAPYVKYIENLILKNFDYITIPTVNSKKYYTSFFDVKNKLKIIPQGFDFKGINLSEYKKNNIPTFAYAGIFYNNIRNPKNFFKEISKIEKDFKFILYTEKSSIVNIDGIQPYIDQLKDKIEIKDMLPREECIKKLSEMDFLVNFNNTNSGQVPSKLIDYSLSKRPILNIDPDKEYSKINEFIEGNYSNRIKIDMEEYDIKNVVNSFESLINKNNII